ncbi:MAG: DUF1540 domain-containing protein [Peptostreptococcaceae bacterium]
MINCDVKNCSHNSNGDCCANIINIGGKLAVNSKSTCCGSFLDKSHYSDLTNSFTSSGVCENIVCSASNCKFNNNTMCTAKNIEVKGREAVNVYDETNCQTFVLK